MFDKSTRTLMAMLFQRGAINEVNTTTKLNGFVHHVSIRLFRADMWRDDDYYMATISGWEDDFIGHTLDEALDQLQEYIDECIEAHENNRRRAI